MLPSIIVPRKILKRHQKNIRLQAGTTSHIIYYVYLIQEHDISESATKTRQIVTIAACCHHA